MFGVRVGGVPRGIVVVSLHRRLVAVVLVNPVVVVPV
jgi:hypothetical protein